MNKAFIVAALIIVVFGMLIKSYVPTSLMPLFDALTSFSSSFVLSIVFPLFIVETVLFCLFLYLVIFHHGKKQHITSKFISTAAEDNVARRRKQLFLEKDSDAKHNRVEWLNVLLHSALNKFVFNKTTEIRRKLLDMLNKELELPDFIGNIDLSAFNLGSKAPIVRALSASEDAKGLKMDVELEYEDAETKLCLETILYINYPTPQFVSLPIKLGIENLYLRAKLRLRFSPDFSKVKFCFAEEPDFDLLFTNEFGNKYVLQNLPKVTDILNRQLHALLVDKLVYPQFMELDLKTEKKASSSDAKKKDQQVISATKSVDKKKQQEATEQASTTIRKRKTLKKRNDEEEQEDEEPQASAFNSDDDEERSNPDSSDNDEEEQSKEQADDW